MNNNNLKPANRKGTTGIKKKLVKPVIEYLQDILDNNKAGFEANLAILSATNPKEYVRYIVDMYKLILPRQIESVNLNATLDTEATTDFTQYSPQQLKRIYEAQQNLREALAPPTIIQIESQSAADDE